MGERWLVRHGAAVSALVMASCLAACGGGATTGSASPAMGNMFAKKVDAVCDAALEQKEAQGELPLSGFNPTQPDLSKLPTISLFEAATVTIFETWQRKMLALGQPPAGEAAWADLLKALNTHVEVIVEQQAAAAKGDAQTFTKDYYEGNDAQDDMVRAAAAAGVPDCAAAAAA
jgi:hypothetical protein